MSRDPRTSLPTGTVTFLFTDIEGSTALLTALGARYGELQARHASLLREAIDGHGGVEVNTEGDAFFVAFASAVAAVSAAAEAQRALAAEPWPDGGTIRVRMGIHTGEGRLGGDDYLGLDVNRSARIASAAHGGQVVLSEATHALVRSDLPDGLAVSDLGRHRLKDLSEPESLWQLDIDGLPTRHPALRTLDARATNLPSESTPLVGRVAELAAIRDLVGERRIVTLTGPGGTGKTRLALAAAASLLDDFADGVFLVELQDAHDRVAVATEMAEVLGVRELVDRGPEESVTSYLRERSCLVVLDNFEQVVSAAPFIGELSGDAPGLRVIVTSREALHIAGEQAYPVPPLPVPDLAVASTPADLAGWESVDLFVQRACEVRPDFALTEANARHVAAIVDRLDGLPLAIELAAARVRLLAPEAILSRLDDSLSVLAGGGRERPDRQRTLRGAIDWSYGLLVPEEQRLFERLSVFAGGWTLDAAEAVAVGSGDDVGGVLDGLGSLSDKSLVRPWPGETGEPRFDMLGVIREYAAKRLGGDAEAEAVRRRHARWVADLAELAEPELTRTDLRAWQERLYLEQENIRAALRWAIDREDAEMALRIAGPLWRYWHYRAAAREGCLWLEEVLAIPGTDERPADRARALAALAGLVYWQGHMERAAGLYDEALAIRRGLGVQEAVALVLKDSVWTSLVTGKHEEATQRAHEAIAIFRSTGNETDAILTEAWLATLPFFSGSGGGRVEETLQLAHRAVEVSRSAGRPFDEADWRSSAAFMERERGDLDAALREGREALGLLYRLGAVGWVGPYFKLFAAMELRHGRYERAAKLGAAAMRYSEEFGGELPDSMMRVGDPIGESASFLDPAVHQRLVSEGRSMALDEAVAYAIGDDASDALGPGVHTEGAKA